MRDDVFTTVFSAINYWFGVAVVECGDEFSIQNSLIFLILVFIVKKIKNLKISTSLKKKKKTKQDISRSYFQKLCFIVNKTITVSVHFLEICISL